MPRLTLDDVIVGAVRLVGVVGRVVSTEPPDVVT